MRPLSPVDVESEIVRLSNLAEKVTSEMAVRAREAAEADHAFDLKFAKALLRAEGKSEAIKKAVALVECEDEHLAMKLTEARLDAAKEAGRNYRAQLDALRSINANLRGALSHASGYGS